MTVEVKPNQNAQLRRTFVNALGQLANSEDGTVVEIGNSLLSDFKTYIAGVSDQERQEWDQVCRQIWKEDSCKGTPDMDRIRSGRVRRELQR